MDETFGDILERMIREIVRDEIKKIQQEPPKQKEPQKFIGE